MHSEFAKIFDQSILVLYNAPIQIKDLNSFRFDYFVKATAKLTCVQFAIFSTYPSNLIKRPILMAIKDESFPADDITQNKRFILLNSVHTHNGNGCLNTSSITKISKVEEKDEKIINPYRVLNSVQCSSITI